MSGNRPHPTHVYAIVRLDPAVTSVEHLFTLKEIVTTAELAEAEVVRLNQLNSGKGCRYVAQVTRLYAPGTSAGSNTRHGAGAP